MSVLRRIQRGIEHLYRLDEHVPVDEFLVTSAVRDRMSPGRRAPEQLLLTAEEGELGLALYLDPDVIVTLEQHDPAHLHEANFGAFLLALEGISHFVFLVHCAAQGRAVSALELELQAEVDKFVTTLLLLGPTTSEALRRRLFREFEFETELSDEEFSRYRAANDNARRYAHALEHQFIRTGRLAALFAELREYYRRPLPAKLAG